MPLQSNLKKYAIIASISVVALGVAFGGGWVAREKSTKPISVDDHGTIERPTNYVYIEVPMTGGDCDKYIARLNACSAELDKFFKAIPEVKNVTADKIYFDLYTQGYSLTYKYRPETRWYISPLAAAKTALVAEASGSRIAISYGIGVAVDYASFGGALIVYSDISASIIAYYRFQL